MCRYSEKQHWGGRNVVRNQGIRVRSEPSNFLGDDGMQSLVKGLAFTFNLRRLELRNNQIEAGGMKRLAKAIIFIPNLEHLDFGWNEFGDEGIKQFANGLPSSLNLLHLNLNGNCITAEGIQSLVKGLTSFPRLRYLNLNLGHNLSGDEEMKHLAAHLSAISNLRDHDLGWNNIGDEGIKHLAKGLVLIPDLRLLHLTNIFIKYEKQQERRHLFKHVPQLLL